jgi:primosomal protein N' (replication factor Y)
VPATGGLVLATAGIEPVAGGGYAAAVLLDGDALLERPDLRAGEEALRRWRGAAALVRPADQGGVVVVCADAAAPAVQALVRGDPFGLAERELDERAGLGLPPAAAVAGLVGPPDAVASLLAAADLPVDATVLGPVLLGRPAGRDVAEPTVRTLIRVPRSERAALARALHAAAAVRSARREPGAVRVKIDSRELG